MSQLYDLVELLENNDECVILKVKDNMQMQLICLGCFNGNETMFRLTKGDNHTCTIFSNTGKSFSWQWGISGHILVTDSVNKCRSLIEHCITDDFGISIEP